MLKAHHIHLRYGRGDAMRTLISDFTLELHAGSLCAVIGANGAGKTSLMRILAGVQEPTAGEVLWQGKALRQIALSERPHHMAALFREFVRVQGFTVYDLAALGRAATHGNWMGKLAKVDVEAVMHALHLTGMAPFAERQVSSLSDGEFQKVMIAKMLAQDAPLLLLDEPTTHLDLPSGIELLHLLRKLAQEHAKTIVFTTHDLHLVLRMDPYMVLLGGDGTWVQGTAQEVANHTLMCKFLRTDQVRIANGQLEFTPAETWKK